MERTNEAAGAPQESPAAYTLLNDIAMKDAVDIAARNHLAASGAAATEEQLRTAKTKATELLKEMTPDGMRDLRQLTISIGMPAAKLALKQLVDFGAAPDPVKASLRQDIDRVSELTEHGCQEVAFFNKREQKPDKAFLRLDECEAAHDLTAQLNKLAPFIPPPKRPEIQKHLTALIYIGRSVYADVVKRNEGLVREILRYLPAGDRVDASSLRVDPANTTLCVHPKCPKRVGIMVTLASELPAPTAGKAS